MDTTYQLVQDFASISWNKARTQKFHPFPWHFLTPFRHFFGDCYIVLLNQGGCATISCWDDHKAYQKLSPWLVVAVCSHRFLYIPIRSKMHICTYIYIHIYTYTHHRTCYIWYSRYILSYYHMQYLHSVHILHILVCTSTLYIYDYIYIYIMCVWDMYIVQL